MKRLVQVVAAFLVFTVIGISFLRAVQLENMLPLGSDDVGYINFHHSDLSNQEIDSGLAEIGEKTGLEVLQLSGTTGTLTVEIISRGSNQPEKTESLAWFRPDKQGSISPASAYPDSPRSGVYALKGNSASQSELRNWLDEHGAIHTWEGFSTWQSYFLPLAYQGVIFILLVTVLLVIATIFSWFITRAYSRIIRLSTGSTRSKIVFEDALALLLLFLKPVLVTAAILLGTIALWKGKIVLQLLFPVLLISLATAAGLFLLVTVISYLVFPKISDWINRRPLLSGYSLLSTILCALVLVTPLAFLPLLQYHLVNTRDNEAAAQQALHLPQYYSLSFGGIVDEKRDYDPHISAFAQLAHSLEQQGEMAFFRQVPIIPAENPKLSQAGYETLVSLNQKAFQDLKNIPDSCQFQETDLGKQTQLISEAFTLSLLEEAPKSPFYFYKCLDESFPIAVQGQGVFLSAHQALILVVPEMTSIYKDELVTSLATSGMLVFSNPQAITAAAHEFGLNLNSDNVSDTIRVYAEDQRLGYLVSLMSLIVLFFTLALALLSNAIIYATVKVPRFFPLYISGTSINQLIRAKILVDLIFILLGVGTAELLSYLLNIRAELLITGTALSMLALTIMLRKTIMRRYLINVCYRRS